MKSATLALVLAACGGAPLAPCGLGTHEEGGICVADDPATVPPQVTPPATPTEPTGSVPSDPQSPTILSVSSNLTRMTDEDVLNIVAIVTDPDGIEDLIGGELIAEDGASYGAFATSAQEGAYEITLTWNDLDTVDTIEFDGEATRRFGVRFYDVAGHSVDREYVVDLYCDEGAACGGVCTDLTVDEENCGSCGRACAGDLGDSFGDTCQQSSCAVMSDCSTQRNLSCEQVCASQGLGPCVEVTWSWYGAAGVSAWDPQCSEGGSIFQDCSTPVLAQAEAFAFNCFCLEP